jgi:hypothetical protein
MKRVVCEMQGMDCAKSAYGTQVIVTAKRTSDMQSLCEGLDT